MVPEFRPVCAIGFEDDFAQIGIGRAGLSLTAQHRVMRLRKPGRSDRGRVFGKSHADSFRGCVATPTMTGTRPADKAGRGKVRT
jgi:hypothetical protein